MITKMMSFMMGLLLCVVAAQNCSLTVGRIIGKGSIAQIKVESAEVCCDKCFSTVKCVAFTFESPSTCYLKDNTEDNGPKSSAVSGKTGCANDMDCELLGTCVNGSCRCLRGFKGESCGELDLAPASKNYSMVWPIRQWELDNSCFSWGFTVVHDDVEGVYHAVVNTGCCRSSTCGVTVGGTYLVHLKSTQPDRGFQAVGVFSVPTTFNPHLIRAPNGTFMLYFRVNDLNNYTVCEGDGIKNESEKLITYIPRSELHPAGGEAPGANMYVAWSASMSGPWQAQKVNISGMGNLHISNPSVSFLRNDSLVGSVMVAYRYNWHGEAVGFAVADSFLGPFKSIVNLTKAPGNDEDPFLWQEKDGSLHILYHNGPHGYHAFSINGTTWKKSPIGAHAFELQGKYDDGSSFDFARRERPELLFRTDAHDRGPAFFYNGINTHGNYLFGDDAHTNAFSRAYSFAQAFN